jgi:hypothetical protein
MVLNRPSEIQRKHLVDRDDRGIVVQADLVDVIHGFLSPDGVLATLITIEFRFISARVSRRVRSATIKLRFGDLEARSEFDPEVFSIAPEGKATLVS